MDFAIGGLAAICAGVFTNPLEVIKIRMQLQGELQARGKHAVHYKNIFHGAYVIAKYDGLLTLQAGLVPALWFQLFLNGVRLGTYQVLIDNGYTKDKNGEPVFFKSVIAGAFTGVLGVSVSSPFYLIKTHLQSKAAHEIASGFQHDHKGMWTGLYKIYDNHGVKGLYRGMLSSIPRASIGSTVQLTSFTYFKEWLNEYEPFKGRTILCAFASSMIVGVFVAATMTPFDLVATRLYNQGIDSKGIGLLYNSYFDCVSKIFKSEGTLGFYKGLGPSYLRIGPHTVLSLVFWDYFKELHTNFSNTNNSKLS